MTLAAAASFARVAGAWLALGVLVLTFAARLGMLSTETRLEWLLAASICGQ